MHRLMLERRLRLRLMLLVYDTTRERRCPRTTLLALDAARAPPRSGSKAYSRPPSAARRPRIHTPYGPVARLTPLTALLLLALPCSFPPAFR
jgi:hypothetical protein